jgi:hypothetical protein
MRSQKGTNLACQFKAFLRGLPLAALSHGSLG